MYFPYGYGPTYKPESYSSYKKKKFHERLERTRLLIQSVKDTSLKPDDKNTLYKQMIQKLEQELQTK